MSIEMHTLKARITFQEEVLGTASNNPNIHRDYIASKAMTEADAVEEVAAINVDAAIEKSMTVFPRNESGNPILWDYQIKGFFKDSAAALKKVPGTKASKVKAFKKDIDGLLFISPRMIPLNIPSALGHCERPLRAATPMGERVALANSETAPAGTTIEIEIQAMTKDMLELARECLDYGIFRGIGQWRNSGKGRFKWEEIEEKKKS